MLVRTCGNRNFHALLMGMQIGVPTLEDSFVVDPCWRAAKPIQYCKVKKKKVKHTPTIQGASLMAHMVKHLPLTWRPRFDPWIGKISWRRKWQSTPVFLLGESDGQWSLMGYSPWNCKELDTTKQQTLSLLSYNLEISLLGIYSKGLKTYVHMKIWDL